MTYCVSVDTKHLLSPTHEYACRSLNVYATSESSAGFKEGIQRCDFVFGRELIRICDDNELRLSDPLFPPAESFTYFSEAH